MSISLRFSRLYLTVGTVILLFSLFVLTNPSEPVFAEIQATPIPDAPIATEAPEAEIEMEEEIGDGVDSHEQSAEETEAPQALTIEPLSSQGGAELLCNPADGAIAPGHSMTITCTFRTASDTWVGGIFFSHSSNATVSISAFPTGEQQTYTHSGLFEHKFRMPGAVDGYRATTVTITITARAEPAGATAVAASFDPCDARGNGLPSNCIPSGKGFSLEVPVNNPTTELIEDAHFHFDCSTISSAPISLDDSETSVCDVLVGDNLGGSTLTLDYIDWSISAGEGWDISLSSHTLNGTSGRFTPESAPVISRTFPYSFDATFTPVGCPDGSTPPELVLKVHLTSAGHVSGSGTSSEVFLTAAFEAPPSEASAVLLVAPGTKRATYSMTQDQELNAEFTARYTVSGCNPWTGYAAMSPFTPASGNEALPVPVLTSAAQGPITITGSGTTTVQPAELHTISPSTTPLIEGTAPVQLVVVEQDIKLKYTVPANTTVGTYESTVTVNISAAP